MNVQTIQDREIYQGGRSLLIAGCLLASGEKTDIFVGEDGTIAATGEGIRKQYTGEAEFVIDADNRIAIPGLVNTHTHAAMSLLRGYADDMHLAEWLNEKIWPREAHLTGEDVYWGTKLACLEMIRSGTVAFNDMYFFMADSARAVAETGMKAQLAYGFIDLGSEEKREAEIKATEALVGHIRSLGNPRITAAVGPHAIYTVSPEGLSWCAEYANAQDIGIHIHLSETEKEVADCVAAHGVRPAVHLDNCGILGPRTVAAHCCWLDDAECRLMGARGAAPAHNPASNMKLAVGRAMPYGPLRSAGAPVTLGTDGCASNNSLDMFEEMKTAALLQKFFWNRDTLLPAHEALAMATAAGALALRTGGGGLAPGMAADIVLVDAEAARMTPLHNTVSNLVYAGSGELVRTVVCDGQVLMAEGEIPGEKEIIERAAAAAADLVRRS
jgi:5-methylthioadenosine/S-adenosylhomocysteine deaminase